MTKAKITQQYDINENGVITSPGKFEGEMYYAVSYWGDALDGFPSRDEICDDGTLVAIFDLFEQDYKDYPELSDVTELRIWEDSNGFVHCQTK